MSIESRGHRRLTNEEVESDWEEVERTKSTSLIERLENLIAALDDAENSLDDEGRTAVGPHIENAYGIAGEILTMIDGR